MKNLVSIVILLAAFAATVVLSRQIESTKPDFSDQFVDANPYFSPQRVKLLAGSFNGVVADYYWMSSLQYIGGKLAKKEGAINVNDLREFNLKRLYGDLDTATTLDPQFKEVFSFGAMVLPAVDVEQAVALLKKGIAEDPNNWLLYQHLGFIYWQNKQFDLAAETYFEGAKIKDAPAWFQTMGANMKLSGGSRQMAREIYVRSLENSDEQSKKFTMLRLAQIDSLDERDAIRQFLADYSRQKGKCAENWNEIFGGLRSVKVNGNNLNFNENRQPVDPTGAAYILVPAKCDVWLDRDKTQIPLD